MLEEPIFAEVLSWRMQCVARFLAMLRSEARSILPGVTVSACLVPPVKIGHDTTAPRAWLGAQSYAAFSRVVDAIHSVIHWSPDVVAYDTRRARDAINRANPACELVTHLAAYGCRRPEEMPLLAQAALGQGSDSLAFFCHDLLDEPMLAALIALQKSEYN